MMARFISMRILPDHSGTENRQIFIRRSIISKHTIQFLGKTLRTSDQTNQTIDILLHRSEILPTVTFANMRSIVIRTEGLNKISFIITRLHKRSLGIIYILSFENVYRMHLQSAFHPTCPPYGQYNNHRKRIPEF